MMITVSWDVMLHSLVESIISEEHAAFIFWPAK
jgi:hypothetical protein